MDNVYKDLDTIAKIGKAGAMSYSFENCTLLKIEQPKKQTSRWNDVTFF